MPVSADKTISSFIDRLNAFAADQRGARPCGTRVRGHVVVADAAYDQLVSDLRVALRASRGDSGFYRDLSSRGGAPNQARSSRQEVHGC